nr:hypothetical protein [Candidatus Omnitrophota bacterium]
MFIFAQKLLFKRSKEWIYLAAIGGLFLAMPCAAKANEPDLSQQDVRFYSDVFNDSVYHEFVDYLNFATLYRKVTGKKTVAANVNIYDEVADSAFYTNRHARTRLTPAELAQGEVSGAAPDLSGSLSVISAKADGLNPDLFVRDQRGDVYLLKFDPADNLELATSAEVIANRFYHALGYNVAPSSIAFVEASQFVPSDTARFYDHTGFKHPLNEEALEELLLFVPYTEDGKLRVSATKLLAGEVQGLFSFHGRRKSDPEDLLLHENRRELRALRIFSSWLSNYDVRRGNTVQIAVQESGSTRLKNYLLNPSASLGAGTHDAKPPMFAHEHLFDYGEAFKAYLGGGFWEKPWQKRWREANETVGSPAVGYFDNRYFDPGKFKVQLPNRAFKNLTNADAFWAAKIIMAFTDDDIRALVKTGQYSKGEDEEVVAKVLIERRDLIGRYWFSRVSPLDGFDIDEGQPSAAGKLVFTDLAVKFGFARADETQYRTEVFSHQGRKKSSITVLE